MTEPFRSLRVEGGEPAQCPQAGHEEVVNWLASCIRVSGSFSAGAPMNLSLTHCRCGNSDYLTKCARKKDEHQTRVGAVVYGTPGGRDGPQFVPRLIMRAP
jgi:hypothetical protein